jgi:hypothetical protein
MGHETANWGGRGLGYMLFNAHLCNQPCYCQVVVEPGAQLSYTEYRGLQVPMTLDHGPVTSSDKSAPGPDPRIRPRIQIGMFRSIRVDHTNCLQVVIKTHSFMYIQWVPGLTKTGFSPKTGLAQVFKARISKLRRKRRFTEKQLYQLRRKCFREDSSRREYKETGGSSGKL